jgi:hypothetical protein
MTGHRSALSNEPELGTYLPFAQPNVVYNFLHAWHAFNEHAQCGMLLGRIDKPHQLHDPITHQGVEVDIIDPGLFLDFVLDRLLQGVVTLSEIGTIWTINQQAKPLKTLA